MNKKISIVVIIAFLAIMLSGCVSKNKISTNDTQMKTETVLIEKSQTSTQNNQVYEYINKDKGFSLKIPVKRSFQENIFGSLVMFFAPQEKGDTTKENLGITYQKLTGDIDIKSFFELAKANVENKIKNFKIQKEEELTINGKNAIKIIYKGEENDKKLQRQQVLVLDKDGIYLITYTATQDTFNDFIDEINTIINTFTIN